MKLLNLALFASAVCAWEIKIYRVENQCQTTGIPISGSGNAACTAIGSVGSVELFTPAGCTLRIYKNSACSNLIGQLSQKLCLPGPVENKWYTMKC